VTASPKRIEMDLKIIDGVFSKQEAIGLLTEMVALKIRYHERQLRQDQNEEDTNHREARILALQEALRMAREGILAGPDTIGLDAVVHLGGVPAGH